MSFWAPVLHFLRQTRILPRIDAAIEYYDLPDLAFLVLLSAFPLFGLLEHSTFWLVPICVLLLLWFVRTLFQKESTKLDFADFLVLLILLLQVSAAFTGYGRIEDALAAALLTSVWFPARRFFERRGDDALVFLSSLALFAVSAVGVGEYLFGMAELRWVDAKRFGDIGGRVTSFFSNPNILAIYRPLYFPLPLRAIFLPQNRGRSRVFYAVTAALSAICILFTWSRGAWLGLGLECLLFLLLHSKKSRIAALFLPPIALLSIPILPQSFRGRLFSIADLGESSIRYRLQTWQGTCNMLGHHPVGIGVGEWAWRIIYPHYAVSGTKTVMHAHNVFLQVATELGFVGLAVFLLLIIVSLRRALRTREAAFLCAASGVLVMGMFDHLWYYPGMLLPFWSMLAFCAQNRPKDVSRPHFVDILHENQCRCL
jgi:putative inorganic carbon (HCO3(-)) transporter